ncbi:MAG: YwbE family protein [Methanobacteriota archaeon]
MSGIDDGRSRGAIKSGVCVDVVQKQDQRTGKKTRGVVSEILTNSTFHPHGIKVRLKDGKVGRVCGIVVDECE